MSHYYTATGELVDPWTPGAYPSATTILDKIKNDGIVAFRSRMGDEAADAYMAIAQGRGTRVHKACEMYALSDGDYDLTISTAHFVDGYWVEFIAGQPIWIAPEIDYFDGFVRWVETYRVKFIWVEKFLINHTDKYAGTTDWVAELIHPDTSEITIWDGDIKTGRTVVKTGLQLRFYKAALVDMVKRSLIAWEHDIPVTKVRMGALYLDPKRACGYRYFKSDWGMLEYKEPLSAIKAHLAVFKWWARKNPVKQREEGIVWEP